MTRSTILQLDLFDTALAVSRWPGDGPHSAMFWRDDGETAILRFFDGVGWCQMMAARCRRCGLWHPLDFKWGAGGGSHAEAWRCPHGEGWH